MRQRTLIAFAVVIAVGLAAGVLAWVRLTSVSESANPTQYWREQGQTAYAAMASASFADAEAIAASLRGAPVGDPESRATSELVDELREQALMFLHARANAETADAHIRWMDSQGYRLKTAPEFESRYGPLAVLAGRAGSDTSTVEAVFRSLWTHPPSSRAVPTEIAVGPDAMAIEIASSNHNRGFTGRLRGSLGEQLWHGGSSATCRFWFQPPVSRDEVVERRGEALAAQVGVIGVVPGAERRPIVLQYFWDPERRRWWLDGVSVTNFTGTDSTWTCCEY